MAQVMMVDHNASGATGVHPSEPRLALGTLAALAGVKLLLHLAAIQQYGYFRDEFYYLACTEHLDWGYVDLPPLSIWILWLARAAWGDSLIALRTLPALAGAATIILVGMISCRLGGRRFAQGLAALAALMSSVFLSLGHTFSMNAFDLLLWAVAGLALLDTLEKGQPRHWITLGVVLGLGLLNKISVLWLGGGLFIGLLLTPYRRLLLTPGPWMAVLVSAALFLPHLIWQVRHDWPTLEFMRNATSMKMSEISPLRFLWGQILGMNPGGAPVWIAGIIFGLAARNDRRGRVFVWIYLAVLALLLAGGRSRVSYLALAYPMLLAVGAVGIERISARVGRVWIRPALVILVAGSGIVLLPLALPLLPVETFVRYYSALGFAPRSAERHDMDRLPQRYADMFGWEEMTELVAGAYQRLSPEERLRCRIFGLNYGEAGAVDMLGRRLGLPPAVSGHNSYWLWTGNSEFDVLILIGGERAGITELFEAIEIVGQTRSPWSMPYERSLNISIARRPKGNIRQAWSRCRIFI